MAAAASEARARWARVARERVPEGLARLCLRQAWAELAVSLRRLRFRDRSNGEAVSAYCAMSVAEFEAVNARQRWANWRSLPRALQGRLPERPCRAVDLCSGTGDSTAVLAYYLPPGSDILGLEYNPAFVGAARRRAYPDATGAPARVSFRAQSVLEPFRAESGEFLAEGSVDLIVSCGALAINFDETALGTVAAEMSRALRAGGLAVLDGVARGADGERLLRVMRLRGFAAGGESRSCVFDRFSQYVFRR